MYSDAYLSIMHHSEYRMNTFIGRMKNATPDFIIELGDFGIPAHEIDIGFSRQEAIACRGMKTHSFLLPKIIFILLP
jgi:Icc protein